MSVTKSSFATAAASGMRANIDEFTVTTDDGSYAKKGFVTDALQGYIDRVPAGEPSVIQGSMP